MSSIYCNFRRHLKDWRIYPIINRSCYHIDKKIWFCMIVCCLVYWPVTLSHSMHTWSWCYKNAIIYIPWRRYYMAHVDIYSCPMKMHHPQKWLYLFNDIKFYYRNCVLLYRSHSRKLLICLYNGIITGETSWKHLTKQPSKQKVTQPAIECVRIFKSIIFTFFWA